MNEEDKVLVERQIMASHMMQHLDNLKLARSNHSDLKNQLISCSGNLFARIILKRVDNTLRKDRLSSFLTKSGKIRTSLINRVLREERRKSDETKKKKKNTAYKKNKNNEKKDVSEKNENRQPVPVVNLSNTTLSAEEEAVLAYGLDHSFIDKMPTSRRTLLPAWSLSQIV